jgi:hypothetical protein
MDLRGKSIAEYAGTASKVNNAIISLQTEPLKDALAHPAIEGLAVGGPVLVIAGRQTVVVISGAS